MYLVSGSCALYLWDAVGNSDDYLVQLAPKRLAYQIEVFEVHSLSHFVVQFVYSSRPYAGFTGKVSLRPTKLAKLPGQ